MCKCISGIAVKSGDSVKVYTSSKSDSHSDIRDEFNIRDDNSPVADRQTPVELIPVTSLTDVSGMEFMFDDERPDWWTDNMTDDATRQLYRALKMRWDGNVFSFDGHIVLNSLASIPEGVTITAGGHVNLGSLTSIPEGVTITAGGHIVLNSLASIPEGVTISAGGYVYLRSLTSISEGVTITAGSYVYLDSLTSISEGVTITGGDNVYLCSLASIPEGVTITAGGHIYLK